MLHHALLEHGDLGKGTSYVDQYHVCFTLLVIEKAERIGHAGEYEPPQLPAAVIDDLLDVLHVVYVGAYHIYLDGQARAIEPERVLQFRLVIYGIGMDYLVYDIPVEREPDGAGHAHAPSHVAFGYLPATHRERYHAARLLGRYGLPAYIRVDIIRLSGRLLLEALQEPRYRIYRQVQVHHMAPLYPAARYALYPQYPGTSACAYLGRDRAEL